MDLETINQLVGNLGLPVVIILYLIWRLDKFLTFLCHKLEKYNCELGTIAKALDDICSVLKDLKEKK